MIRSVQFQGGADVVLIAPAVSQLASNNALGDIVPNVATKSDKHCCEQQDVSSPFDSQYPGNPEELLPEEL